jgi:hypothetical protein
MAQVYPCTLHSRTRFPRSSRPCPASSIFTEGRRKALRPGSRAYRQAAPACPRVPWGSAKVAPPIKHQMSLAEIAEETGMSVAAVNVCLGRALRKLRKAGLLKTAAELARELDNHRNSENIVRTARRR